MLWGVVSHYLLSDKTWRPLKTATSSVNSLSSHLCSVADIASTNTILLKAVAKILTRQFPSELDCAGLDKKESFKSKAQSRSEWPKVAQFGVVTFIIALKPSLGLVFIDSESSSIINLQGRLKLCLWPNLINPQSSIL